MAPSATQDPLSSSSSSDREYYTTTPYAKLKMAALKTLLEQRHVKIPPKALKKDLITKLVDSDQAQTQAQAQAQSSSHGSLRSARNPVSVNRDGFIADIDS